MNACTTFLGSQTGAKIWIARGARWRKAPAPSTNCGRGSVTLFRSADWTCAFAKFAPGAAATISFKFLADIPRMSITAVVLAAIAPGRRRGTASDPPSKIAKMRVFLCFLGRRASFRPVVGPRQPNAIPRDRLRWTVSQRSDGSNVVRLSAGATAHGSPTVFSGYWSARELANSRRIRRLRPNEVSGPAQDEGATRRRSRDGRSKFELHAIAAELNVVED